MEGSEPPNKKGVSFSGPQAWKTWRASAASDNSTRDHGIGCEVLFCPFEVSLQAEIDGGWGGIWSSPKVIPYPFRSMASRTFSTTWFAWASFVAVSKQISPLFAVIRMW